MASNGKVPKISETAFCCPHCGAYTTQYWHSIYSKQMDKDSPIPYMPTLEDLEDFKKNSGLSPEEMQDLIRFFEIKMTGEIFLEPLKGGVSVYKSFQNLVVSECYNCTCYAVWVYDRLVYPSVISGERAHEDMPPAIARDFEEARAILDSSPRGASALLRLCVQKLCGYLGEKGKNIDDDIASLVSKGLNPLIQKSLDIVRVVGNESVHPGVIDISDDRASAQELLVLVNLIVDQMISQPRRVQELYEKLPESKRMAIEARNEKSKGVVKPPME